jgi:hypothetical protein
VLILERKILTVCCELHTKQINALRACRKSVEFLKDKLLWYIYWPSGFNGFMGILNTCSNEIKTKFTTFEVSVCSDYEECRFQVYDAVWPGINLLTCRRNVLYPYHTPETSVNFYRIARRHVTTDFNINNFSVVFIWFFW